MLPYLLVLSFVIMWIVLEQQALNRKSFWLPLIVLSLFAGVRSFYVGSDSGNYTRSFVEQIDADYLIFDENIEAGYQILKYSLLSLTYNYFWLFWITGLIVVYCYLKIIKQYSVNYWFSVFLFITLGVYTFFFNGLRQGLAMALFVLATPYLLEKRITPYLLIIVLASLFHTSALFMIPFYFIVNIRIKMIYKILMSFLGSLLASRLLIVSIATTNERYEGYTVAVEKPGGFLILGFYIALLVFIYYVIHIYEIKNERFLTLFTFYAVGVVFIIPIAMLGTNPSGPQRLLSYFTWSLILILPVIFKRINNAYFFSISVFLFIIYFMLTTSRFSNLTPYIINPVFEVF